MKASRIVIARVLLLSGVATVAGCVPAPESTPAPSPAPVQTAPAPVPTPTPTPAPTPHFESWMDAPATPGTWTYKADVEGTTARFGAANSEYRFTIACNPRARSIQMLRFYPGIRADGPMTIRTETTSRTLSATGSGGGGSGELMASLQARDPLLDAMALTKGRFAVDTPDLPTLYLPAWAEVTRVIEDCR
ncbi:hypothetical protein [Qipengyuania sphaerica]|uniref:hypothetical protein n=1 Tax=Qipengyuania sphaerica TaxID=2867243 RepID=UPI001C8AAED4|nr:hypothetical protein [Qipengyuania sphaerica]MBX7541809.1 hypothetical protein [Qipengyuania sphaerica]